MSDNKFIQRIPKHYVGDSCFQIMHTYRDNLVTISSEGIIYSSQNNINAYLNDSRRIVFPYHNIPMHYDHDFKKGGKIFKINCIFDLNKSYINLIKNKDSLSIIEYYGIKEEKETILISQRLDFVENTRNLTRKELDNLLIVPQIPNSWLLVLDENLNILNNYSFISNKELLQMLKSSLLNEYTKLENTTSLFDSIARKRLLKEIDDITLEDLPNDLAINKPIILIRCNNGIITIEKINIYCINENCFKVVSLKYYPDKELLIELKEDFKRHKYEEPDIINFLNPHLTDNDINSAKEMIRLRTRN